MLSGLERADPSDWYKYIFPSALIASYFLACAIALLCKKRKRLYWKITAALGVLAIFCCIQWGYAYISVQRLRNRQLDTLRQIDVPITLPNPLPTAARIPVILHHN